MKPRLTKKEFRQCDQDWKDIEVLELTFKHNSDKVTVQIKDIEEAHKKPKNIKVLIESARQWAVQYFQNLNNPLINKKDD